MDQNNFEFDDHKSRHLGRLAQGSKIESKQMRLFALPGANYYYITLVRLHLIGPFPASFSLCLFIQLIVF